MYDPFEIPVIFPMHGKYLWECSCNNIQLVYLFAHYVRYIFVNRKYLKVIQIFLYTFHPPPANIRIHGL